MAPLADLYVRVAADTLNARRQIQSFQDKLRGVDRTRTTAQVSANTRLAQAEITVLQNRLEKLRLQKVTPRVELQTARAEVKLEALQARLAKLSAPTVAPEVRTARGTAEFNGWLARLRGQRVQVPVDLDMSRLQASSAQFARLLKLPALTGAAALAGGALASLGAGMTALTSAAGPAVGALAGVGGAGAALGQGFLVAKFATSGLSDAMKAVNAVNQSTAAGFKPTAAQVKKVAIEYGLTSAAGQRLVTVLLQQSAAFGTLKDRVQGVLLPQLATSIQILGSAYLPMLTRSTTATAAVLRDLARDATYAFSGRVWRQDVDRILTTNVGLLRTLGGAALPLANVVRNIWVAALPLAQRFSQFVQDAAFRVSILTSEARRSGALGSFFRTAGDTAAQLGRIIGNVGGALLGMGRAAFGAGQTLLGSLEGATRRMRDLAASASGQNAMRDYFARSVPVIQETGRLLSALAGTFARLGANPALAPLIRQVRTQLLPAFERLLNITAGSFGSQVVTLLTNLANVFARLSAGGGALSAFLGTLVSMSGALNRLLATPGLGQFVNRILALAGTATALGLVVGSVGRIAASIGRLVTLGVSVAGFFGLLSRGGAVITGIAVAFLLAYRNIEPFRDAANATGRAVLGILAPLRGLGPVITDVLAGRLAQAGQRLAQVGGQLRTAAEQWLPQLSSALSRMGQALVSWIGPRIGPTLAALGGFFSRVSGWVTDTALPALGRATVRLGTALTAWIGPRIGPALSALEGFLVRIAGWVGNTGLPMLGRATARLGQALVDWIGPRVGPAITALGALLGRAVDWFTRTGRPMLVQALNRLGDALWRWVEPRIPALLGALGEFAGRAVAWLIGTGAPRLENGLEVLGRRLIGWVAPRIPGLLAETGKLVGGLVRWVATEGVPTVVRALTQFGVRAVAGFVDGFRSTDLGRAVGGAFTRVRDVVAQAMSSVRERVASETAAVRGAFSSGMLALSGAAERAMGAVRDALSAGMSLAQRVVARGVEGVQAAWDAISRVVAPVRRAFEAVRSVVSDLLRIAVFTVQEALRSMVSAVADSPIAQAARRIWQAVRVVVTSAVGAVQERVSAALSAVAEFVADVFGRVLTTTRRTWNAVREAVATVLTAVQGRVNSILSSVASFVADVMGRLLAEWRRRWTAVRETAATIVTAVRDVVADRLEATSDVVRRVLARIRRTFETAWTGIRTFVSDQVGALLRRAGDLVEGMRRIAADTWSRFRGETEGRIGSLIDWFRGVPGRIADTFGSLGGLLVERVKAGFRPMTGFINSNIVGGFNAISKAAGASLQLPFIPGFARGGVIPGQETKRDSVLFAARPAESVMVPEFTRAVGGERGVRKLNRAAERGRLRGRRLVPSNEEVERVGDLAEEAQARDPLGDVPLGRFKRDRKAWVFGSPPGYDVSGAMRAWNSALNGAFSFLAGRGPLTNQVTVASKRMPGADWQAITDGFRITMNDAYLREEDAEYRRSAVMHEMGHVLGLDHTNRLDSIMSIAPARIERMLGAPSRSDIAGALRVFPPRPDDDLQHGNPGSGFFGNIFATARGAIESLRQAVAKFVRPGVDEFRGRFAQRSTLGALASGANERLYAAMLAYGGAHDVGDFPAGEPGVDAGQRGGDYRRVSHQGKTLNARTLRMLRDAERNLRATFRVTQGSYRPRTSYSGGTHMGGGALDVNGPRGWATAVRALRGAGFAAWHRTPAQGPWGHHIHALAIGDRELSPSAAGQVRSFQSGGTGLRGLANGGIVKARPGGTPVVVGEGGRDEVVIPLPRRGDGDGGHVRLHPQDLAALAGAISVRVYIGERELQDVSVRAARGEIQAAVRSASHGRRG